MSSTAHEYTGRIVVLDDRLELERVLATGEDVLG
jgi:hypothetical protein